MNTLNNPYDNMYLYLLMRNDMDSMNGGKAVAHGAHAANQFTHQAAQRLHVESSAITDELKDFGNGYDAWIKSANGFGTTITLHMSLKELQTVVMVSNSIGCLAAETSDSSYPYILHKEYARLITHPDAYPPKHMGKGMMMCLREEVTAGYVFGDRDTLKPVLGNFPMMP